ncbi:hypothetical protein THIAE_05860 [Thiomicrospira aerophila AL3]|uniref:DUF2357 domain-containing protein n=1 Tax=Thiomicrospira aerophila AL3 TaxID=717772 RepID=W0DRW5_9GAMM|nr:DUF2357 domain-containing protein [Thiomicrospira aerophila]AHF01375.1 hypothetical protein THIAE_05860 [Thiomicrospira aerophila AL3]
MARCGKVGGGLVIVNLIFSNNLGWFSLPFRYVKNGMTIEQSLSFEVWPFKMDMARDLNAIYKVLDQAHPLLRFSWKSATEQEFNRSRFQHEPFELLWLAEFKSLNEQMKKGYKQILNAPHNRLLPEVAHLKAERLKGKLPNKLAEKARADIQAGLVNRRYALDQKRLSVDTPENQFIKYALNAVSQKLEQIKQKVRVLDNAVAKQDKVAVFSDAFYKNLDGLIAPYQKFKRFPLFKEVGDFKGLKSESLVLQQKTGYSAVYQAWHKLKYYLDVLGDDAAVSVKNIAELYEVWCFLQLADILKNKFSFKQEGASPNLVDDIDQLYFEDATKKNKDRQDRLFLFSRGEGTQEIKIELKHEFAIGKKNKFAKNEKSAYVAWMAEHKPDIFMKVTFADKREYVWLFDAKYRIDPETNGSDMVPVDALAQMHRYRDAIIHQRYEFDRNGNEVKVLSRPVYGAYALYPGYFKDQKKGKNPYHEAIDEIDIGAFPFLPSNDNTWLVEFLSKRLGVKSQQVFDDANAKAAEGEGVYSTHLNNLKSAKIFPKNYVH